ncbi:hypothetical protein YYC_02838 [Plasmodium yoelii 17X]|uniref:Uncharacterized protein n=1 Tax=Plasmodium yoelii 17X TaxID=1323249 RepID=V7PJZ4_PLAYE|nr:hypothetical protein YYC_02838 [Plasmodium yoelii 17X]
MDRGLVFDQNSKNYTFIGSLTNMHCPGDNCDNDDNKKISSAFIAFLNYFNNIGIDESLDSDKIAEYAILWLGHKLNQKTQNGTTTLNEFYNNHIETNSHYNKHIGTNSDSKIKKEFICKKIKSMNIGIKDIFNFYEVFKLLCKMGGEVDKIKGQCNKCLENSGEFYEKYEKLINGLDINKGSSYFQLWLSLSKDYDEFKEKYSVKCNNIKFHEACPRSSVTKSQVTKSQVTNCPVTNCPVTECQVTECQVTECPVTKNTLITIAIIFVAASILLGVSYKCNIINTADKYVVDDPNNPGEYNSTHLLKVAFSNNGCNSDDQKLSSGFIALLTLLNDNNNNENLEGDKLVEYAILWLSYKLNQKKENETTKLYDLYTKDIETNSCYKQKINDNSNNKISKDNVREWLPSQLDSNKEYQISDEHLNEYCTNKCEDSLDKISAGCLYLLNEFFKDASAFDGVAKGNIYIIEYILIWLSYMLNLIKTQEYDSIKLFYDTYIKDNVKYTNNMQYISRYKGYKDLIDRNNYFLNIDMGIIPKLYDAFNTLCDINNELDTNNSNCTNYSEEANQFVEKYKKIIIDHNITEDNSYFHVLINLLIDYENLKNRCKFFPSAPDITKIISEHVSDVTSSSSIASKLIPILSILVAIAIFLGISYKVNNKELKKKLLYICKH